MTHGPETSSGVVEAVSGLAAGMSQVLVGHPFDTVKVQLQTGRYSTIVKSITALRLSGLYSGIWSPLLGIGLCNSVLFHSYSWSRQHVTVSDEHINLMISGALSGIAMAIVNCPVELMKVKMQTNRVKYKNIFDCGRQIAAQNGFVGLFRGLSMTMMRDAPSFVAYFGVYEYMKRVTADMSTAGVILSGATAGIAAWLPCYPQDVIKSVIQSHEHKLSISDAIGFLYKQRGWRAFASGFGPTMARAIPANAVTFLAYESVRSALKS